MVKWSKLTDISTISTNCQQISTTKNLGLIDNFDDENFVILRMVMVKFELTILTMSPQYGQIVRKSW
jgi:hypothetical protein